LRSLQRPNLGRLEQPKRREADLFAMAPVPVFRAAREGQLMSALGQKQAFALQKSMSALPPKADMCGALAHGRFGLGHRRPLFDHPVGSGKQRARLGEAERAFAVLRLITLLYLVGACIGRSSRPFAMSFHGSEIE
jgi:hypothetical protein